MLPASSAVKEIGDRVAELLEEFGDPAVVTAQVVCTLSASEQDELIRYFVAQLVDDVFNGGFRFG